MAHKKTFGIAVASLLVAMVGCVSSDVMSTGGKTYPPRPDDYVIDVYSTTDAPVQVMREIGELKTMDQVPAGSAEIGRVDARGASGAHWGAVVNEGKAKARQLGGDGIVIKAWDQPVQGVGQYGNVQYAKDLSISVIRYGVAGPATKPAVADASR